MQKIVSKRQQLGKTLKIKELRKRNKLTMQRSRYEVRRKNIDCEGTPSCPIPYKSSAFLGKAKCRAMRTLPKSPRKLKTIVRKLALEFLQSEMFQPASSVHPAISSTDEMVISFYENDMISRVMPGKADAIVIRSEQGKKKVTK